MVDTGRWLLTHAIWRNSLGSYQPETGVRRSDTGKWLGLVEHGWSDFDAATSVIVRMLQKGRSTCRIGTFMERLAERRRRRRGRS